MDSESRTNYRSGIDFSEENMAGASRGRDSSQSDSEMIRETLSRVRRTETRVTSIAVALGVHTGAQKPEFQPAKSGEPARIIAPSKHSSLNEIVDSVPKNHCGPVKVFVGEDPIAVISVGGT